MPPLSALLALPARHSSSNGGPAQSVLLDEFQQKGVLSVSPRPLVVLLWLFASNGFLRLRGLLCFRSAHYPLINIKVRMGLF